MNAPTDFVCPLTNVLMRHPMIDKDALDDAQLFSRKSEGNAPLSPSYERSAIFAKLQDDAKKRRKTYCQVTGLPLSKDSLVLNKPLQWKIKFWAKKNFGSFEIAAAAITSGKLPTHNESLHSSHRSSSSSSSIWQLQEAIKLHDSFAPKRFLCPLSKDIMKSPVTSKKGTATFDRRSILRWLDSSMHGVCPVTDQEISRQDLVRNDALADQIQEWKSQRQKQLRE